VEEAGLGSEHAGGEHDSARGNLRTASGIASA
jgi:hypothetical protein